jgi:hypothetical protein
VDRQVALAVDPGGKLRQTAFVEERLHLGRLAHVLRDGQHPDPDIGAVGDALQGRQLDHAGRAPCRPQVDEHRLAREAGEPELRPARVRHGDVGQRLALLRPVQLGERLTGGRRRRRLRLVPALPIATPQHHGTHERETEDSDFERAANKGHWRKHRQLQ